MDTKYASLRKLLSVAIDIWGLEAVTRCLIDMGSNSAGLNKLSPRLKDYRAEQMRSFDFNQIIADTSIDERIKPKLLSFAEDYKNRLVLNSAGDIKSFYLYVGERPIKVHSRAETFISIIRTFERKSATEIEILIEQAYKTAPSRLEPLAEAISRAGNRHSLDRRNLEKSLSQQNIKAVMKTDDEQSH